MRLLRPDRRNQLRRSPPSRMRLFTQSVAVAQVVMAGAFVSSCSGKADQDNAASVPQIPSSVWSFTCLPMNEDANRFGPVAFETDFDVGTVAFKSPASWRTHVEIVATPPQDSPERNLKWVTKDGKLLTGRIGWRDDAELNPDTFGVLLGMRAGEIRWAKWACKAVSGNGS